LSRLGSETYQSFRCSQRHQVLKIMGMPPARNGLIFWLATWRSLAWRICQAFCSVTSRTYSMASQFTGLL
jgi:hypothetical protein